MLNDGIELGHALNRMLALADSSVVTVSCVQNRLQYLHKGLMIEWPLPHLNLPDFDVYLADLRFAATNTEREVEVWVEQEFLFFEAGDWQHRINLAPSYLDRDEIVLRSKLLNEYSCWVDADKLCETIVAAKATEPLVTHPHLKGRGEIAKVSFIDDRLVLGAHGGIAAMLPINGSNFPAGWEGSYRLDALYRYMTQWTLDEPHGHPVRIEAARNTAKSLSPLSLVSDLSHAVLTPTRDIPII